MISNEFSKVNVLDNFYQTSSFYPMPVVMITTVSENGLTNIGSYSLCFPFGIADKHAMMLISRKDSNTSINIGKTGYAALNFIPYNKKYLKNAVRLGYPGETTEQKQKDSIFTLIPSKREEKKQGVKYPEIIEEAIQVIECTWCNDQKIFSFEGSEGESHYLLYIDNIFMKNKWYEKLKKGKGFPKMPIDYGYRDSKFFWFAKHSAPYSERIPSDKCINVDTIKYQVQRLPYELKWEEEAYKRLVKVPRIFLKRVLESVSQRALDEGITCITPELLDKYNDKKR